MKVGVLVNLQCDATIDSLDAKFAELRELGVDNCQLVVWDRATLLDPEAPGKVVAAMEKNDIRITAFWCGWQGRKVWDFYEGQLTLGLVPSSTRQVRVEMLLDGLKFAKAIGVTDVATHVGYMPENPYDPAYQQTLTACKTVIEECVKNGQRFLFETGQETPVTLKRAIQDIEADLGLEKGKYVGINLDPANLILYGKANPVDALDVFGEYVYGIHGKDGLYPTDGHNLGLEVPVGKGKVNYPVFVEKLKEIGYPGDITIEREITADEGQKKDIIDAIEILNKLIEG